VSKQGKEATIALLGPGDFLGEGCIASDQTVRMATASATSDCAVLRIQRKILRVLHQERAFSDTFVAYLLLSHLGKKDRPETVIPEVSQVLHD
jgi:CRP/FNR family transcriptional regulator, cyclic AMP receptor protein